MPVLIQENWDAHKVAVPVSLEAKVTIERGLPGLPPMGAWHGKRVNDLSPLYPASELRAKLIRLCAKFVERMAQQGYERLTAEADFRLWGPYIHKPTDTGTQITGTVRPQLTLRTLAHGHHIHEFPHLVDVTVKADFISTRTRIPQERR